MKVFNPMQYLAIDIANHFGLDKLNYEERIDWVKTNINSLENMTEQAEEPILFAKAVHALRQTQQGIPTGHTVAFDATCSGLQLMSLLTNCKSGMSLTGLIDPNKRSDAYTQITEYINYLLKQDGIDSVEVSRKDAKQAIMTSLYGSKAKPKELFGKQLLPYFYKAMDECCTGAMDLLSWLLNSWQDIQVQSWVLPDGHTAYIPTMQQVTKRVSINELNYTPVVTYYENIASDKGIANAANVVHSVDALVLRELVRRCNYHKGELKIFLRLHTNAEQTKQVDDTLWINERFKATGFASISFIEAIEYNNITKVSNELREALASICEHILSHPKFEVITIHDSFACSPVNMQRLREHYNNILVELYESHTLDDLLSQVYQTEITVNVGEKTLSNIIRNSNYGIN